MIRGHRCFRLSAVLLIAAAVGGAPGCTLFDEVLPGTPFTPDQPVAQVTLEGEIHIDSAAGHGAGCASGRTLLWGVVRNTGDLDVDDVFIEIDALDANNVVLDTYRVNVFNGTITEVTTPEPENPENPESPGDVVQTAGTSLAVGESGTFETCTRLPFGSVAGTAYRTDFIVAGEIL